ncbi:MAG: hypothetical protein WD963_01665 [Candidatus Paceibacterota bacterium]
MKLRQTLFWDTDPKKIDLNKNKRYVIERVLDRGRLEEYKWLRDTYTLQDIKDTIARERSQLDVKSKNFWSSFYRLDSHAHRNSK